MKVHAKNILWDTDGEDIPNLPHETMIDIADDADINLETADALSDKYGFCVFALDVELAQ